MLSNTSPLPPCPHGMSTLAPRQFIVYRKPDHATQFWMTHDGRGFVGTTTLIELARELAARRASQLYALPGRPSRGQRRPDPRRGAEAAHVAEDELGRLTVPSDTPPSTTRVAPTT